MDSRENEIDAAIQKLLDKREERYDALGLKMPEPDIIEIAVADDTTNKNIITMAANEILAQSAVTPDFLVILRTNKSDRGDILKDLLDAIQPQNYSKVFFVDELLAYPIGNVLVPQHQLCTKEMEEELMIKYQVAFDKLPKILLRDVVARWYGWKANDLILVKRIDGEVYYRLVVE